MSAYMKKAVSVSTHSRPKAAGFRGSICAGIRTVCFNTQPPEGGWLKYPRGIPLTNMFQHTAARRRLADIKGMMVLKTRFNTQPPEGGWTGGF